MNASCLYLLSVVCQLLSAVFAVVSTCCCLLALQGKILEVSPDQAGPGFRVHGSMRLVDQAEGADMDPTGQMAAALAKSELRWLTLQLMRWCAMERLCTCMLLLYVSPPNHKTVQF
jgi:hypothetical protein